MHPPPGKPVTPQQVIACLIWRNWHPAIAFYQGSKQCRRIGADLIRRTVAALRKRRTLPEDVRVLVGATDLAAGDAGCERSWRDAIDGLRVLYHASPVGTPREKKLLIEVARNRRLVAAMRAVAKSSKDIAPNWLTVFAAEGSAESNASVDREPSSGPMSTARFWRIVDQAGRSGTADEALRELLEPLSARQVAAFDRHFTTMLRRAYRRDLWGAAYLMLGGCSDDAFRDFRAELIGRGRAAFARVLKDPDALADGLTDIEGDEALANVANDVYLEKVGRDLPAAKRDGKEPAGRPWNFDDASEMRRRYPRLYRRFGRRRP